MKEKVCVHTSRDIRAIASQLVRVWIEVFRKEKASNGRLKLLKVRDRDPQSKISKSNKRLEGRAMRSEATLDVISEASSLRSQRTAHAVDSDTKPIPVMSQEEAAAFAAAEAARAAAIAAAQVSITTQPFLAFFHTTSVLIINFPENLLNIRGLCPFVYR